MWVRNTLYSFFFIGGLGNLESFRKDAEVGEFNLERTISPPFVRTQIIVLGVNQF